MMKTHDNPIFKKPEFVRTAEGQTAMFYGDQYFRRPIRNTDLLSGETGTDPVLDSEGRSCGALLAYPTGRILVCDAEKAAIHRGLITRQSEKMKNAQVE